MFKIFILMFTISSSTAFAANCLSNIQNTIGFLKIQLQDEEVKDLYIEAEIELSINKGLDYLVSKKAFKMEEYKSCCQTGEKSVDGPKIEDELAQKARIMLWKMYDGLDANDQEGLENKVRWLDKDLTNACFG